jgi:hypothetical protein
MKASKKRCLAIFLSQIHQISHINFVKSSEHCINVLSIFKTLRDFQPHSTHWDLRGSLSVGNEEDHTDSNVPFFRCEFQETQETQPRSERAKRFAQQGEEKQGQEQQGEECWSLMVKEVAQRQLGKGERLEKILFLFQPKEEECLLFED